MTDLETRKALAVELFDVGKAIQENDKGLFVYGVVCESDGTEKIAIPAYESTGDGMLMVIEAMLEKGFGICFGGYGFIGAIDEKRYGYTVMFEHNKHGIVEWPEEQDESFPMAVAKAALSVLADHALRSK